MTEQTSTRSRRATNLSIDQSLLTEARRFEINISRAAEEGILQALKAAKQAQWKIQNQEALESSNAYVDKHGLPLARYRQF